MKMAPLVRALGARPELPRAVLIHTGQHYDVAMNDRLFADLELPAPDLNLEVGSGTHALQTAEIMRRFEPVLDDIVPSCVIVVGDVNSTLACSLVASKKRIPVVHVEAGLRSFDRNMPEEMNRVLTDQIADRLYTTERIAAENLAREGIDRERVRFVGNVMIDSLLRHRRRAIAPIDTLTSAGQAGDFAGGIGDFGVVTLHRPSNVDALPALREALTILRDVASRLPLIWPVHPRAKANIERFGLSPMLAGAQNHAAAAAGLSRNARPDGAGAAGTDRLRWDPGRDDGACRAVLDDAGQYRASDHRRAGHQYSGRPQSCAHARMRRRHSEERRQTRQDARAVGRPRRRADRR